MQRDDQRDLEAQQEPLLSGGAAASYGSTASTRQPRVLTPAEEKTEINATETALNDLRSRRDIPLSKAQSFFGGCALLGMGIFTLINLGEEETKVAPRDKPIVDFSTLFCLLTGLGFILASLKCTRSSSLCKWIMKPFISLGGDPNFPIDTSHETLPNLNQPISFNSLIASDDLDAAEQELKERSLTAAARELLIPVRSSSSSAPSSSAFSSSSAFFSSSSSSHISSPVKEDPFSELKNILPRDVLGIIDQYLASALAPEKSPSTGPANR